MHGFAEMSEIEKWTGCRVWVAHEVHVNEIENKPKHLDFCLPKRGGGNKKKKTSGGSSHLMNQKSLAPFSATTPRCIFQSQSTFTSPSNRDINVFVAFNMSPFLFYILFILFNTKTFSLYIYKSVKMLTLTLEWCHRCLCFFFFFPQHNIRELGKKWETTLLELNRRGRG